MAKFCGFDSLDALIDATVPQSIRRADGMPLGDKYHAGMTENDFIEQFNEKLLVKQENTNLQVRRQGLS